MGYKFKEAQYESQKRIWREKKRKFIKLKGDKCERCGYCTCIAALEFHHLDPTKKEIDAVDFKRISYKNALLELEKCILLCANCHREEHHLKLEKENTLKDDEFRKLQKLKELKTLSVKSKCPICNKDNYKNTKYCSKQCLWKGNRKIDRPSKETLLNEIKNSNYLQLGKKYGVSDNCIRKWLKYYEKEIS